jgi:hypothetical protein
MIRPDAMDRDVAALMGLDAVIFAPQVKVARPTRKPVRAPGAARPARKGPTAQQSPWLWVIVPLAVALVVGVGMTWRSDEPELPEQTAQRPAVPELRPSQPTRAMSLKVIDGPDRRPQRRPQNFPAWEIDPSMARHAPAPETEVAQAPDAPPAPEPAPEARVVDVEPMSLFSDPELAPSLREPRVDAPEPDPAP